MASKEAGAMITSSAVRTTDENRNLYQALPFAGGIGEEDTLKQVE